MNPVMNPVIAKFRSALSGFNRRDVTQYLEQSSAAHRKAVAELEQALEESRAQCRALEDTLAGLEDEKGSVAAEEARVRASLEESTAALAKLRGELSRTDEQLVQARAELERLQQQVGELSPMAQSYGELKDRVATVELDAHRKAQATVDEAQRQADALRDETRRWLEQVLAGYDGLRLGVDELLRGAQEVLRLAQPLHDTGEGAARLRRETDTREQV